MSNKLQNDRHKTDHAHFKREMRKAGISYPSHTVGESAQNLSDEEINALINYTMAKEMINEYVSPKPTRATYE